MSNVKINDGFDTEIRVRLSTSQKKKLTLKAKKNGLTLSAYVRTKLINDN